MRTRKALAVAVLLLLSVSPALALNKARVIYGPPSGKQETAIQQEVKASGAAEDVASFINDQFSLSVPLSLVFGREDGPLYDPQTQEIVVPYAFLQEVKERFVDAGYPETGVSVSEATMDVLMHTLFHELAHALIFTCELPVVGKEEDAADGLASVLLIEFYEHGAEMALSAADLFDLESEDIETFADEDFQDDHSLDIQRFYTTLCHVYGSDPETYADLKTDAGFSEDRAQGCIEEYERLAKSWFALLEPHRKQGAKSR